MLNVFTIGVEYDQEEILFLWSPFLCALSAYYTLESWYNKSLHRPTHFADNHVFCSTHPLQRHSSSSAGTNVCEVADSLV